MPLQNVKRIFAKMFESLKMLSTELELIRILAEIS